MPSRIEYFKAMAELTDAYRQCGARSENIAHYTILPGDDASDVDLCIQVERNPTESDMSLDARFIVKRLKHRPQGEQVRPEYKLTHSTTKENKEEK